ncbi:MAG: RHS repeat-associated core domain-containing protein, partial [Bacteroidota bacterium]|nr:RHS repeat-associated core domain-containing protein [Bacteroidota bacterium]
DAYDNIVFEHVYDLRSPAKEGESIPPLKTTHINKGTSTVVFDCTGKPIETRDAKDALTLHVYDILQRPLAVWCRDNSNESVGLRQYLEYGTNAGDNNKGKLWKQYDEAGYQQINAYDFKGNVLEKFRQVIRDSEILNAIATWSAGSWNPPATCYRVDWGSLGSPNASLLDGVQYQTNMLYDGLNRIKEITYPEDASNNRKVLVPTYNKAGALFKVSFDGTEYVKEIAYNAKGQRLLIAYGNDMMTRYVYDENTFRLLRLKTEKYTYSQSSDEHHYAYNSGTTKQDFAYQYDLSGNIISINDETPGSAAGGGDGLERVFEYDALYRLLNATGRENQPTGSFWDDTYRSDDPNNTESYAQAYTYDLMGNIAELAHTANNSSNNFTREFNYSNNLLDSIAVGGNTYNFNYDTCGNMTRENSERFFECFAHRSRAKEGDYADRLRLYYNQSGGSTEPSVITHYMYDAGGNRVKKFTRVSGGDWESITYIDGLIEYREDNTTNRGSISHVLDDTTRIATVRNGHDFGDSTPSIKYNLDDHLGSSSLQLDTSGTLVSREEYYPFGETSFGSYGKKRYRFCGKEKDEESGLYYYGARYYSSWTCRFISVDPHAGKYVFQTPYAYADNNPICKMDYNGEGSSEGDPKTSGNTKSDKNTSINKTTDNLPGSKLNIIVDEPEAPAEAKSKIEEYKTTNPEKEISLKKEWEKYDKEYAEFTQLKAIKDRIDNATSENDPVIYELKEKLLATAGEKNITLKAGSDLYIYNENDSPVGNRLFAKTSNVYSEEIYIIFDLKFIETAPSQNIRTKALDRARLFNKNMGAPNDPNTMQIELGGIITHELGHVLDFFSKNGNFTSKDEEVQEFNPREYEFNYYKQKYLPAYFKK